VVDVGVGQKDRPDICTPFADEVDRQLRLEVGIDDDRVVRVLVLYEV